MNYVPSLRDSGKFLACRAENRELPESTLEDGWKLEIYCECLSFMILLQQWCDAKNVPFFSDVPQAVLGLGKTLNASNIKEGDDVYFECNVRANPKPYKISWRFNVSYQDKSLTNHECHEQSTKISPQPITKLKINQSYQIL